MTVVQVKRRDGNTPDVAKRVLKVLKVGQTLSQTVRERPLPQMLLRAS